MNILLFFENRIKKYYNKIIVLFYYFVINMENMVNLENDIINQMNEVFYIKKFITIREISNF